MLVFLDRGIHLCKGLAKFVTSLGQTDIAADALIAVDAVSLACKANLLRVVKRSVTTIVRVESCVQLFGCSWHPSASYLARLG